MILTDYMTDEESCAAALQRASDDGWTLNTYSDPTADGEVDCSVEHAAAVATEDPSLVYLRRDTYTVLPGDFGTGARKDEAAACERMEAFLGEHYTVRLPRQGEAEGTYLNKRDGSLQILGFTLPVPPHVHEATGQAWVHAGETWPTTTEETDR